MKEKELAAIWVPKKTRDAIKGIAAKRGINMMDLLTEIAKGKWVEKTKC